MGWMSRFSDHIYAHPRRLVVTICVIISLGWLPAGIALNQSIHVAHQGRVENCRSLNELRREIYVAARDLGASQSVTARFKPTVECESIP